MPQVSGVRMNGLGDIAGSLLVAMLALAVPALPLQADEATPTKVSKARLQNSKAITPTMHLARYDRGTGLCTQGSLQLLTEAQIAERKAAWNDTALEADCVGAAKKATRKQALYPVDGKGRRLTGAAHLLLELDESGSIARASTVCATSEDFARAAAATAANLEFSPRTCAGRPVRSTVLLPFAFDP